ncbi:WXG100 family type VII secretion target [Paenibacillus xylanexedens]|uniref:WXG100 family type VII secretion target n=1 Tax=Paenibacillus xylanexedens TaxID=528191 RepID=A0ABS4RQN8_PAEXY|nr:WXG100 family type VII secretion target [Paenibacillus xylanexedens]MBP2245195.1 WXG100 family type VII secretion target [Paenibacillus xylanexedens]
MQRIEVHPDLLEEKARLVQQKKQELERMVWELEKSIYMLQSDWSGVTGERFFWDFMQVKEVFPTTLGLLDEIQKEFTFIAMNFRTTDGSGEVALYIPEELKRNFAVGLLDKSVGETITGMGQTAEAFFDNPFSTIGSVAYAMTVGKVVDVGRGIQFAWDTAWGTGTARSDIEQFVEEQKKQVDENGAGYYGGAMTGQALAYVLFGKAFRSMDDKHTDLGGSGGGKKEVDKGSKQFNAAVVTKTNKGLEIEFENPYGSIIKWVEQNPKNIPNAIESAMNSRNTGKAIEGKVGDFVQGIVEVTGFGLKLDNISTGKPAGDIDVMTHNQIIEVKKSISSVKIDQIDKYVNPNNSQFFNYEGRRIVLYIDESFDTANKQTDKMIKEFNSKGVTVVSSLEELGGVLK